MRAAVVAGSYLAVELDRTLLDSADLLVAVDAGADALARVGLMPATLIGDMDSVSEHTRRSMERQTEVVLLETAKDETDTEAALRLVVERGADDITVYGALGGPRLDHLAGNLLLLSAPWLAGVRLRMIDDRHEACLVNGDTTTDGNGGDIISLLPLSDEVKDVRTEGLQYPLFGETLFRGTTRGISNVMTGSEARVTHGAGLLLLIKYRGR